MDVSHCDGMLGFEYLAYLADPTNSAPTWRLDLPFYASRTFLASQLLFDLSLHLNVIRGLMRDSLGSSHFFPPPTPKSVSRSISASRSTRSGKELDASCACQNIGRRTAILPTQLVTHIGPNADEPGCFMYHCLAPSKIP